MGNTASLWLSIRRGNLTPDCSKDVLFIDFEPRLKRQLPMGKLKEGRHPPEH
jgi:hypothetical protein